MVTAYPERRKRVTCPVCNREICACKDPRCETCHDNGSGVVTVPASAPPDDFARTLELLEEAARRANWDAQRGPEHLRTGRFLVSPVPTPHAWREPYDATEAVDAHRRSRL